VNEVPHDAVHVRTLELQRSDDAAIFDRAASDDRVLVSADTDFGALLALRPVQKPSVIQFRGRGSRRPDALAQILLSNLSQIGDALTSGSVVTFEPSRIRLRLAGEFAGQLVSDATDHFQLPESPSFRP
jgi:predicted nuclease of predicted toxin-antitoxin system